MHYVLLAGATGHCKDQHKADERGLFQWGVAKCASCVARSADGPGPRGSTAGAALAQWHPPISFVGR